MRQKLVVDILANQVPSIIPRIRQKLHRWHLYEADHGADFIAPRILALRAASNLQFIFKNLPPKVGLSYFAMLWNRCPTARRLQQAHPC
eukprot:8221179-Alexandrium_andersonii.AAC.1